MNGLTQAIGTAQIAGKNLLPPPQKTNEPTRLSD
jgi:hypothetical protein